MKGIIYLPLGKEWVKIAAVWLLAAIRVCADSSILPYAFKESGALFENYSGDVTGANSSIMAVCEDESGTVYAAAANRLLSFDGSSWSQTDIGNTSLIRSLAASKGRVWMGGAREAGYFERNTAGV